MDSLWKGIKLCTSVTLLCIFAKIITLILLPLHILTSLQTDNHASISSLNYYRLDALHDAQPSVKVLKTISSVVITTLKIMYGDGEVETI